MNVETLPLTPSLMPLSSVYALQGVTAVPVPVETARLLAELLTSHVLDNVGEASAETTMAHAYDALQLLDILVGAGVGCAAELCRDELTDAYRSAAEIAEGL